ncbi:ABC transporter permease [Paenibacillus sambharensis]|uniref:ABC transporter permease n=1 Tax=Paenibacillus sambharensis TaxID=1803190 RepID=A0A2W1LD78_9BACL|nr:ABC transporter permease subunit [Paenibacillus sambharensis]PZD97046.1 ABC transporter permease [Paenibacillus sambharensis]
MKNKGYHYAIILLLMAYLLLPLAATLLFALAKEWQATILPSGWTLEWFAVLLQDARFLESLGRSLLVCTLSVLLSLAVMVPTIYIVTVYMPKLEKLLYALVLLPYALPGVVMAVGLIRIYSGGPVPIAGTLWILVGAYFVIILPYMYQGIRNALRTVNARELTDAAELLGATRVQAFRQVVLPNILPGITVSVLLSFSILFGEFVLANLLVGGRYETVQIYLYKRLSESGHLSSAVAIAYFGFVLILSGLLLRLGKWVFRTPDIR